MWGCLACGEKHEDDSLVACPTCKEIRKLPKKDKRWNSTIRPQLVAIPSRDLTKIVREVARRVAKGESIQGLVQKAKDHRPHLLDIDVEGKVFCSGCKASQFGNECWAQKNLQRRLDRRKEKQLYELLTDHEVVYNLLFLHEEARESDIRLFVHYFKEFHPEESKKWTNWEDFLTFIEKHYQGANRFEGLRRRRQEIQAAGIFPSTKQTDDGRQGKERTYRRHFGSEKAVRDADDLAGKDESQ